MNLNHSDFMKNPKISLIVPIYGMDNAEFFLKRNLDSILSQTFTDYEIIITDDSDDDFLKIFCSKYPVQYFKNTGRHSMADNTNCAIDHASGDLIKILYQDDYFYNGNSLDDIDKYFVGQSSWFVTGCTHTMDGVNFFNNHSPYYSESDNTIGSPSVLTFTKEVTERFDPQFHYVLDLDLYKRLFREYGKPKILNKINVVMGIHSGQKTNLLSNDRKILEHRILKEKHESIIRKSSIWK